MTSRRRRSAARRSASSRVLRRDHPVELGTDQRDLARPAFGRACVGRTGGGELHRRHDPVDRPAQPPRDQRGERRRGEDHARRETEGEPDTAVDGSERLLLRQRGDDRPSGARDARNADELLRPVE